MDVFTVNDGNDYEQVVAALKTHGGVGRARPSSHDSDRQDDEGLLAAAVAGKIPGAGPQVIGYQSHPYAMKMNSDYFVALAKTFEEHYGVEFEGIRKGAVSDTRERLIQFKTNIDVVMSLLDRNGLGDWLANGWWKSATRLRMKRRCISTPRTIR